MSLQWEGLGRFGASLSRLGDRADDGTRRAVVAGAHLIQRQGMLFSSGRPGPNVRSGAHRRSWVVDGPRYIGRGTWEARVGPTMVYSRALELGHPNWGGAEYPSLGPAMRTSLPQLAGVFYGAWRSALG